MSEKWSVRKWLKWFLLTMFIILLVVEAGIRISGIARTFTEEHYGEYISFYSDGPVSWYHTHNPNSEVVFGQDEFNYKSMTNSLGFREREFISAKQDSNLRIFTIGDSFTDGDGAPFDSSYPRFLERKLMEIDGLIDYEVFNAGVCGSDLFYERVLLEDKLLQYDPDLMIFLVGSSDVEDVIHRGGRSRFKADGTVEYRQAPPIEKWYRYSHIVRVVCNGLGYDYLMMSPRRRAEEANRSIGLLNDEIIQIKKICAESDVECVFFWHPVPDLVVDASEESIDKLMAGTAYSELYPLNGIRKFADNPEFIHLLPYLSDKLSDYELADFSWPIDRHYNSVGYEAIAEAIYTELMKTEILPLKTGYSTSDFSN